MTVVFWSFHVNTKHVRINKKTESQFYEIIWTLIALNEEKLQIRGCACKCECGTVCAVASNFTPGSPENNMILYSKLQACIY